MKSSKICVRKEFFEIYINLVQKDRAEDFFVLKGGVKSGDAIKSGA